jgi:hypothetical protein
MKASWLASVCALACACGSNSQSTYPGFSSNDAAADSPDDDKADSGSFGNQDSAVVKPTCTQLRIGILGNSGTNASANFQKWLNDSGTSTVRVNTTEAERIDAQFLSRFDVVILDSLVREYSLDERAAFTAWIESGKAFISMTGYNDSPTDFRANSLVGAFGLSYGGQLRQEPVRRFAVHPVTVGLTQVTFTGGYQVSASTTSSYTRTPIAFLLDNTNVGYVVQASGGRGFVWGDEWIEFDSEWSTRPDIKALWVNVFKWLQERGCPLTPPK